MVRLALLAYLLGASSFAAGGNQSNTVTVADTKNAKDLEDISTEVRADLRFGFVTHADEVLKLALVEEAAPVAT